MNVLVVDTSAWITYFADEPNEEIDLALKEGRVWLPPIVAGELLSAALTPSQRKELRFFLNELSLCECDLEHWARVGELRAGCAKAGIKVSTPDAHIAQCALDLKGYLVTGDKIFERISPRTNLKLL